MAIYQPVHQIRTHSRREIKAQLLAAKKANREYRQERSYRTRGKGAREDIELANIFREFGVDYLRVPHAQVFQVVRNTMENRRADSISTKAMDFLTDNFDATVEFDDEERGVIRFPAIEPDTEKGEGKPMRLYSQLAEKSGTTRKTVRSVYEALLEEIKEQLQEERFIRLPEIGRLKINYRKPREKRRGRSPFTGKKMWFKAKPASNKLRFSASKSLKEFVRDDIEVVEPEKKGKKKHKKH